MKVTPLDLILCTLIMSIIFCGALIVVQPLSDVLTVPYLGTYHVVADVALMLLAYGILSALAMRLMLKIRPLQTGEFDMSHANFTYWKLLAMVYDVGEFALKPFTTRPMKPLMALLFGARVGKNVAIAGAVEEPYLISIGHGSVIGFGSLLSGFMTSNGKVTFGRITIGNDVTVGANSVVMPNVTVGDGAVVGIGSVLLPGTVIPPGEQWRGNPARKWM